MNIIIACSHIDKVRNEYSYAYISSKKVRMTINVDTKWLYQYFFNDVKPINYGYDDIKPTS